jgi:integrase
MAVKWVKTNFPGVRYRKHPIRKKGVNLDQYFTIRYKLKGKDKEEGLGWASQNWTAAKAYQRLKELKENQKAGEGPQTLAEKRKIEGERKEANKQAQEIAEKENVTFGQFMTGTYLPQSKLDKKAKTHEIESMLYERHIADTIGALTFPTISAFHLEKIKKTMADKKLSARTIEYALQTIRQGFNMARKLGIYTGDSPTKAVKWPKLDNMKLRYLSIDEAETLLAALAAKSQNLHDEALLSLNCGLRFGEIAALTWSCVNLEAGTLAILNAKTGSRTAYLTDRAKAMLENRKQGRPDALIFPKRTKKKAGAMAQSSRTFTRTVDDLKLNEGITDRKQRVTFHTLRHTYATHLYESTHDLYLTQRSLGHATGTMTARYAKMSESRLREGAAALQKAFTNGTKQAGQVVNFKK